MNRIEHYHNGETPDQIKNNITNTRIRMENTIEQLSAKLDPTPYVETATEWAKDKAQNINGDKVRDGAQKVSDAVKSNPIPVALAGLAIASIFLPKWTSRSKPDTASDLEEAARNRVSNGVTPPGYDDPDFDRILAEVEKQQKEVGSPDEPTSESGFSATTDKFKKSLSKKAKAATSKIADTREKTGETLRSTTAAAKDKTQQLRDKSMERFESGKQNSPALLGLGAVAVGFLAALALPKTRRENEVYGEHSDSLKQKASDKSKELASALTEKAHEKGLDPESLKDRACDAVDEAADSITEKMDSKIRPSK